MKRVRNLALEALAWPFLEDRQRLVWAAALEFDAVPTQDLPPWFFERQNFTRRHLGVDLFSLDGKRAVLCRAGNASHEDVKRFLRTAKCVSEASQCTLWTLRGCQITDVSKKWLRKYGGQRQILTKNNLRKLQRGASARASSDDLSSPSEPPLRRCQEDCLEACAKGARVIEMACGTGKTRVIRELAAQQTGKVLVTVPSLVLLEQFSEELPDFCKVGTRYNDKIDMESQGFVAVTKSVHHLQELEFETAFVDEAHHPLSPGLPSCKEIFKFSATQKEEVDFRYSLGEAIEQEVLCDYDLTVPVTTQGHCYICLVNLLLSQAGRFRRVLAYCNSVAEAKRFQQVLEIAGLAVWHINGESNRAEREKVMREFSQDLQKPVHVLVTVEVLGEGVNIPNADTCMFVEPRSSYISIIQAIGRVLRPHLSKPMAHVVLPGIAMPAAAASAGTTCKNNAGAALGTESMTGGVAPAGGLPHTAGSDHVEHVKVPGSPKVHGKGGSSGPATAAVESSKATARAENKQSIASKQQEHISVQAKMGAGLPRNELARSKLAVDGARTRPQPTGHRDKGRADGSRKSPSASELPWPESNESVGGPSSQEGSSYRAKSNDRSYDSESLEVADCWPDDDSEQAAGYRNRRAPCSQVARFSGELSPAFEAGHGRRGIDATYAGSGHQSNSIVLKVREHRQDPQHHRLGVRPTQPAADSTKLRVKTSSRDSGSEGTSQLDRFLEVIAKADSRFVDKDAKHLQSRLCVMDSQLQQGVSPVLLDRRLQYQLALILQQRDPWELCLQEVETFLQDHRRFPRVFTNMPEERTLAHWLQDLCFRVRRQLLPAGRMQKLLNSSCSRLRSRVAKWLDPETPFDQFVRELREFVRVHKCMPIDNCAKESSKASLARRLQALLSPERRDFERRLQILAKEGPIVAKWAMSRRARKPRLFVSNWRRQLQKLREFVRMHSRMPRSTLLAERSVYVWSLKQRSLLDRLPAEIRAELLGSHPEIASFMQG
ncbi:unnamed protein product [Symbiodinium sp. CCMP2456]|nr:unnamed protein product [Symbiodinium sp. CCMP2456]